MANYSLLLMLTIMLSVNIGLGLFDYAVSAYNPLYDSGVNYNNTPVSTLFTGGNISGNLVTDTSLAVPSSSDSVDPDTGNIFTDTWKSVSNFFSSLDAKLGIIGSIIDQPRGFLLDVGVPAIFANAFGLLWYLMAVVLLVSFIKGGGAD